jgi:eukaryotic-like serine/threonine-protein kinase
VPPVHLPAGPQIIVRVIEQEQEAVELRPEEIDDPAKSRWRLREGDEIVAGLGAVKRLGGGFRYEAYLAWDDRLLSLVVVKVVRPGLVEDEHTLGGLRSEIEMLERLSHPVLLRSFGSDLEGRRPHVILEHLEGPRLSTLVRKYGPLPPDQLLPLGLQLCAAAHYMAGAGVVHLDIKPSNIIMGAPARLIDLSVARTLEDAPSIGSPVGTDAYMAPEQCQPRDRGPIGPAADSFGIGVTLYRAASGQRPFPKAADEPSSPEERWPQLVHEPEPLDAPVPDVVRDLIMSCLAFDPAARPTPAVLAAELEPVFDALPGPRISKLKPRRRRR